MAADFDKIKNLTEQDIECLKNAEVSYGDSWRKRGGIGAFMMLARKWDRIETVSYTHLTLPTKRIV